MPRLSPAIVRHVKSINPHLARLLPVCRDVNTAQNELRWLREHAGHHSSNDLASLVLRRAKGEPLQYILGSEYFGSLEIACRPGVLIPRQETAASISYLVHSKRSLLPRRASGALRILDVCSGTGCIPLLLHHEIYTSTDRVNDTIDLVGVDVSDIALSLARHNHKQQSHSEWLKNATPQAKTALAGIKFVKGDLLAGSTTEGLVPHEQQFDVLISNPPYISQHHYRTVTSPSVRRYEPKLALVPCRPASGTVDGDQFYPHLWRLADEVGAKTVLLEVGDLEQALRVANMGHRHHRWDEIQLWRDCPDETQMLEHGFHILGQGNVRSVFARRESSGRDL